MSSPTIDYERLSRELVRALRGKRSQRAFGRRMRFTSNVVYAWESGRRAPSASVFFRMALNVGLDAAPALQIALLGTRRAALSSKRLATAEGIAELLRELAQNVPVAGLARALGVDRSTVTRWLRGRSEPRLPELLRFIDATVLRLLDVIEQLVDPESLPSVRRRYLNLKAQRQLAFDLPFSHAALRALELDAYGRDGRDATDLVAAATGVSRDEAASLLRSLVRAGQVKKRRGRYVVAEVMTVDTRLDVARDVALKRYWAQVAVDRIDQRRLARGALASYNVFTASARGYERIRKLHLDYYDQVRRIIASDDHPERVVLMNLHLMPLEL